VNRADCGGGAGGKGPGRTTAGLTGVPLTSESGARLGGSTGPRDAGTGRKAVADSTSATAAAATAAAGEGFALPSEVFLTGPTGPEMWMESGESDSSSPSLSS
jgi:hypothetical protein